jgi:pyruvate/2-oxoglutarate dehydrogenase complex dihydrolipoamide dehydrogenase (E3) component
MAEIERYDAVVVGSGEAGKWMAWHLGGMGKRVAVVERRYLGGACPNVACLPSKNVIHSAKVASYGKRAAEFGLSAEGRTDMARVRARKDQMVAGQKAVHVANFDRSGATILWGTARFVEPRTFEVTRPEHPTRTIRGDQVFLDTGTRARIDPIPGLREAAPMTHVEALDLDVLPEHLLVLGAGYVGLELAQAIRRFGSRVTVLQRSARVLPREDADVAEAVMQLFEFEGVDVLTQAAVSKVEGRSGDRVRVQVNVDGHGRTLEGSHLLVATGRLPNTEDLTPARGGVETTDRGYIKVDERLQTTAPATWAMGDCAGSPHFTHIAFDDFRTVRDNLAGGRRTTTGRQVPFCLFTDPELARVGLDEQQAKQQGVPYRTATLPGTSILRAQTLSETRGFLKALVGENDDRILGFTALAEGAGEMLPPVQLAMREGLPYTAIRDLVVAHPTMAEGLVSLFSSVPPRANP